MSREEIIERAEESLHGMIEDINKAWINGSKIGAVMLAACAIEILGGLLAGGKGNFTSKFKGFLKRYLPEYYTVGNVYKDLRCDLVHFYGASNYFYTESCKYPQIKNLEIIQGKRCIVVDIFIKDVERATRKYIDDIKRKPEIYKNLETALRGKELLGPTQLIIDPSYQASATTKTITGTGSDYYPPVTGGP